MTGQTRTASMSSSSPKQHQTSRGKPSTGTVQSSHGVLTGPDSIEHIQFSHVASHVGASIKHGKTKRPRAAALTTRLPTVMSLDDDNFPEPLDSSIGLLNTALAPGRRRPGKKSSASAPQLPSRSPQPAAPASPMPSTQAVAVPAKASPTSSPSFSASAINRSYDDRSPTKTTQDHTDSELEAHRYGDDPAQRAQRLAAELRWLENEKKVQEAELKHAESKLRESRAIEKQATVCVRKDQENYGFHKKRSMANVKLMNKLSEEHSEQERAQAHLADLAAEERRARRRNREQAGELAAMAHKARSSRRPSAAAAQQVGNEEKDEEFQQPQQQQQPQDRPQIDDELTPVVTPQQPARQVAFAPGLDDSESYDALSPTNTSYEESPKNTTMTSGYTETGNSMLSPVDSSPSFDATNTNPLSTTLGSSLDATDSFFTDTRDLDTVNELGRSLSKGSNVSQAKEEQRVPHPMDDDYVEPEPTDPLELAEFRRDLVRDRMVETAGTAKAAFKIIDLNGSGGISMGEFADGLTRLKVDWMGITSFGKQRDVFKLFDQNGDGLIDYIEMFPHQARIENAPKRVTTPDFWKTWCRKNPSYHWNGRNARWNPSDPDEEMEVMHANNDAKARSDERKDWMRSSFRRLKGKGKTDARARECIASHLPRGTGPLDRDKCPTFSQVETIACKKKYVDEMLEPVKSVQKIVYEMRDQRRVLQSCRQSLYAVTLEPINRQKAEQEKSGGGGGGMFGGASSMGGFGGMGLGMSRATSGEGDDDGYPMSPMASGWGSPMDNAAGNKRGRIKSTLEIANHVGLPEEDINKLLKSFMDVADKSELVKRKEFVRLLEEVASGRTLVDCDIEHWWGLARKLDHSGDSHKSESKFRKQQCNFEQFVSWFADSELRT